MESSPQPLAPQSFGLYSTDQQEYSPSHRDEAVRLWLNEPARTERRFRMTASDLMGHGPMGPHVHFELLNPGETVPYLNQHVTLYPQ